ncbi:MAG: DUF1674 domain-containing protein [Alphaproteobacteria bacterium]|nr:DUF1674 domain-containing protein [Alphaproteobacteria bacterium]
MANPTKTFRELRPTATPLRPRRQETAPSPLEAAKPAQPDEIGGPTGLEPTRYGDWERGGRCTDF